MGLPLSFAALSDGTQNANPSELARMNPEWFAVDEVCRIEATLLNMHGKNAEAGIQDLLLYWTSIH